MNKNNVDIQESRNTMKNIQQIEVKKRKRKRKEEKRKVNNEKNIRIRKGIKRKMKQKHNEKESGILAYKTELLPDDTKSKIRA